MTDTLDLRPPQRSTRGMIGVPTTLTASLLDADGEPKEAEAVDLYIGGPISASWPLPDPLGDVTKITGTLDEETGLWMLAVPGLPAGTVLLRLVVDSALVGRLLHHVGSEGSASPTTELVVRDGAGLVLHLTAIGSGDGGGGGTVDSVARAAITSHTEETTAAHGGIVASTDPRLSDARTPTAHTHTAAEVTDLGSAATADVEDFAQAAHTHAASEVTDLGNSATRNVGNTAGTVAAGDDPRFSSGGGSSALSVHLTGTYQSQPGPYTNSSSALSGVGQAAWVATWCPAGTYDALGIWVAGTTSVTMRLCVDSVSATTGLPSALLADAGTVDCSTSTGLRLLTLGSPLVIATDRWVWCRVVVTAYAALPNIACLNAANGNQWPPGLADVGDFSNRASCGLRGNGQATGPDQAPAPAGWVLASASTARTWLRRSA